MKKTVLILIISLILSAQSAFLYAETQSLDPYSFDKTRNLQPVLQENFLPPVLTMRMPDPVVNSAPKSPAMVTDAEGNKYIYEDGELSAKVDLQGNQSFYSRGQIVHERDYDGALTKTYEYNGAKATVKNEFGEVTGYQKFGQGGLLLEEYDEEGYLSSTRIYKDRALEWVLNSDGSKTKYDLNNPEFDYDFEGNVSARYVIDNRKIKMRIEKVADENGELIDGDCTVYDNNSQPLYKTNFAGDRVLTYEYGEYNRLKHTRDQSGFITEYNKDRQTFTRHESGSGVYKVWNWQGSKLVSTEDKVSNSSLGTEGGVVTYYKNNKPLEARFETDTTSAVVKRWIYDEGQLIAQWEATRDSGNVNKIILFDHGRPAMFLPWEGNYPTHKELYDWAKSKRVVSLYGETLGFWDSNTKELVLFDRRGNISKTLFKDKLPAVEELPNLL